MTGTGAIIGGFTILGAFLTLTAWLNGRSTKKLVKELHEDTDKLLAKISTRMDRSNEILAKVSEQVEGNAKILAKISEQIGKVPEKTAYLLEESRETKKRKRR